MPAFTTVTSLKVPVVMPVRNSFEMLLGPVFLAQISKAALKPGAAFGCTAPDVKVVLNPGP